MRSTTSASTGRCCRRCGGRRGRRGSCCCGCCGGRCQYSGDAIAAAAPAWVCPSSCVGPAWASAGTAGAAAAGCSADPCCDASWASYAAMAASSALSSLSCASTAAVDTAAEVSRGASGAAAAAAGAEPSAPSGSVASTGMQPGRRAAPPSWSEPAVREKHHAAQSWHHGSIKRAQSRAGGAAHSGSTCTTPTWQGVGRGHLIRGGQDGPRRQCLPARRRRRLLLRCRRGPRAEAVHLWRRTRPSCCVVCRRHGHCRRRPLPGRNIGGQELVELAYAPDPGVGALPAVHGQGRGAAKRHNVALLQHPAAQWA